MPRLVYDTRFFVECFFSDDTAVQAEAKDLVTKNKDRAVSAVTIHELYLLELSRRGREIARLRVQGLQDMFRVVEVDSQIAIDAAEIRLKHKIPMGDSIIAATCRRLAAQCVTDDPHLTKMKEIKTRWI
jgi:predicted nucleic acid-binding protein